MPGRIRVGIGHDVHALKPGFRLVLGGVEIAYDKGLEGWSDADVLVHAVMDALLGAAALGDIGTHFPPGEAAYQGISSLVLLGKVKILLDKNHWQVGNVDAMILVEKPKLKGYMETMAGNIAGVLGIQSSDVSVKAGTNEKMGYIGRGEGIAVHAVALIESTLE
jgi:2-C-methyl-D-erythritol 2,4-cyclodiphosphate synthase